MDIINKCHHIAFIMDGNGRWAKKKLLPRTAGHFEGCQTLRKLALYGNKIGIKAMTFYAFSTENWKRDDSEVSYIMNLPKYFFDTYLKELIENNVVINIIGELDRLPQATQKIINDAIEATKNNNGMILTLAFNYGSQREIFLAAKKMCEAVAKGDISVDEIDESYFESNLMTSNLPPIDLMIRTSGEIRLSNYLLYQLAYSELVFTQTYWPDFNEKELESIIKEFLKRNRRFGGV